MISQLAHLCGTTLWTKEPKFVIWLAFGVEYLVIEGAKYMSLYLRDHLSGNTLCTLLPQKIKRPMWFIDKVKVESVILRVWNISWCVSLSVHLQSPHAPANLWEQNRLWNSWHRRPVVYFGSYKVGFCHLAKKSRFLVCGIGQLNQKDTCNTIKLHKSGLWTIQSIWWFGRSLCTKG